MNKRVMWEENEMAMCSWMRGLERVLLAHTSYIETFCTVLTHFPTSFWQWSLLFKRGSKAGLNAVATSCI